MRRFVWWGEGPPEPFLAPVLSPGLFISLSDHLRVLCFVADSPRTRRHSFAHNSGHGLPVIHAAL
jgi:hypothetical protein